MSTSTQGDELLDSSQWVPNNASKTCMVCDAPFSVGSLWKHHCRICGALVCSGCSQNKKEVLSDTGTKIKARCCDRCWNKKDERPRAKKEVQVAVLSENQRWAGTWGGRHLLPLDPMRYTGLGDGWPTFPTELGPPIEGGSWLGDWKVENGDTEHGGWIYAFDFPAFQTSIAQYSSRMGAHSYVRRRRWIREWTPPGSQHGAPVKQVQVEEKTNEDIDLALVCPSGMIEQITGHADDAKVKIQAVAISTKSQTKKLTKKEKKMSFRPAALGRIYARPINYVSSSVQREERDFYLRLRCRCPRAQGIGWIATQWKRTLNVVHRHGDHQLKGGVILCAIASPRTILDVQVRDVDSDALLAYASLSAVDLDPTIELDPVARLIDSISTFFTKSTSPETAMSSFFHPASSTKPKKDTTQNVHRQINKQLRKLPLKSSNGKHAGHLEIDAVFETSYLELCWAQRRALPMAPENPSELSHVALKQLVERTKNLIRPILDMAATLRLFVDWKDRPGRTMLSLVLLLAAEYRLDATRVLAVAPLGLAGFLFYTLYRRVSGKWKQSWIERTSVDELVPCFVTKQRYKELKKKRVKAAVSATVGDDHKSDDEDGDTARGEKSSLSSLNNCLGRRAATVKLAVRRVDGEIGDLFVLVQYLPMAESLPDVRTHVAILEISQGRACTENDLRLGKELMAIDFDLHDSPWLRRIAQTDTRRYKKGTGFEDDAMEARLDTATQDFVQPWNLQDTVLPYTLRYPVLLDSKLSESKDGSFLLGLYRRRSQTKRFPSWSRAGTGLFQSNSSLVSESEFLGETSLPLSRLVSSSVSGKGTQPPLEVWLPLDAENDDESTVGSDDDNENNDDMTPLGRSRIRGLLVASQLVLPDFSLSGEAYTAEEAVLSRLVDRLDLTVGDDDDDEDDDELGNSENDEEDDNEADSTSSQLEQSKKSSRRGPIAELQAARMQVLEMQAAALRFISYFESAVNLLCWVQPGKTLMILVGALMAVLTLIVVPLNMVLMCCTLGYYYDQWLKMTTTNRINRRGRHEKGKKLAKPAVVDERLDNLVRSVPDSVDLARYFAPRTQDWLDVSVNQASSRLRLQRLMAPFAGLVLKTSGLLAKSWQRRYVVIDQHRRLLWWAQPQDIKNPPKAVRYLASGEAQAKLHHSQEAIKLAPAGYPSLDLLIPYSSSELPGAPLSTHFLCALTPQDAVGLRAALAGFASTSNSALTSGTPAVPPLPASTTSAAQAPENGSSGAASRTTSKADDSSSA